MKLRLVAALSSSLALACLSPEGGGDERGSSGEASSSGAPTTGAPPGTSEGSDGESTGAPGCACGPEEACIAGSCVDVGRSEVERGCNPLGDPAGRGQCLYPWPADVMLPADPDAATGLRLAYDPALLPVNDAGQGFAAEEVTGGLDGYSPHAQLRFAFAAEVDPADLPPQGDLGASLAADATIVLIEEATGERWPLMAELDATAQPTDPTTVFVRPMRRLTPGRRYVVGVRGLRDGDGATIAAAPLFAALRDGLPTDVPALEALRDGFEGVFATLATGGVARAELQLAWAFTTASEARLQRDFLAIAPQVEAAAGAGDLGYTLDEVEIQPSPELAVVLRGRFTVPSCLTDDAGPGTVLRRDGEGLPDCSGTAEAPLVVAVPQAVWDAGVAVPFVVYGHGLLGTGEEAVGIARRADGIVVAGTDFWGMAEEDLAVIVEVLSRNFVGGRTLPDRLLQSAVNFTALAYLGQGDLLAEPALQRDGSSLIDPTQVHYLGGSQGGIMGGTVLAMAPPLQRGVLVVGGANYSLMIWRSTAFSAIGSLWLGAHADPQAREFLFAVFQSAYDASDPLTYADLLAAPWSGGPAKRTLLIESIGDAQVPNLATETMARSYGLQMLAPAVTPVFGVPEAPGSIEEGSALLQVDTGLGPLPPAGNLPAESDNGAHGAAVDAPAVLGIVERFIFKGVIENLCDGACDPG